MRPGAHETRHLERETATSIRTLLAEYETIAHQALKPRWADLLARAGLTNDQIRAVEDSPAHGALSTALRRADAHGLPLAAALPRLVDGAGRGAVDLAAILHARVERFTDAAIAVGRDRPARLVGGLIPAALHVADTEAGAALAARERLVEERADLVLDRALTAGALWVAALGPVPADEPARSAWTTSARTVAAFRDRCGVTDQRAPLGPDVGDDRQRSVARDLAQIALAGMAQAVTGRQSLPPNGPAAVTPRFTAPER